MTCFCSVRRAGISATLYLFRYPAKLQPPVARVYAAQ
jgi:hypothetical protein